MGLIAPAVRESARAVSIKCPVGRLLRALDKGDAAELRAALTDPDVRHVDVERALRSRAVVDKYPTAPRPNAQAVSAHRQGACKCPA